MLLAITAAVAWIALPAREPLALLAGATALLTLLAMAVLPPASVAPLLVPLTVLQCIAVIGIAQAPNRSKSYWFDRRAASRLPLINTQSRVLPLSEGPPTHPYTRPLALFYAPMLDGYASASGHRFALTSTRLDAVFPASVSGVPAQRRVPLASLLNSNFLKLADISYLVVQVGDTAVQGTVMRVFPQATVTSTPQALIFDIGYQAPRAFFATEQRPGNPAGTQEVLFGQAPLHAVVVEGDSNRRALPAAQVSQLDWSRDRIDARVAAPAGGLLVFSTSYSGEWQARADGQRQRVVPVDEVFAGVWVPAGAQRVTLTVRRWPLYLGLVSAMLGATLCFALVRRQARTPL
jgi:hypothetical protein